VGDLHRLIAFDLDGTLVDSRRDLADSANELITSWAAPRCRRRHRRMVGEGAAVLIRRALTAAACHRSGDALARFLEIYDTRLLAHTRCTTAWPTSCGSRDRSARRRADKQAEGAERPILEGSEFATCSTVCRRRWTAGQKAGSAALNALMRDFGATPHTTLLVGDSAIDHETAIRAGVRCCLVSFGFGYQNFPKERLRGDEWIRDACNSERPRNRLQSYRRLRRERINTEARGTETHGAFVSSHTKGTKISEVEAVRLAAEGGLPRCTRDRRYNRLAPQRLVSASSTSRLSARSRADQSNGRLRASVSPCSV
jgi:phosphoglycolate phosphatase